MRYRVIDDYYRQEHFDFFRPYQCPIYAVTVPFEIRRVRERAKARGYSLHLHLCYLFTKALQEVEDFRYRLLDGRIVLYDELHLGTTVPAPGGRFSFAHFRFDADEERFHRRARSEMEGASGRVSLASAEHPNYLRFTSLPKVPFTAMTHAWIGPQSDACNVAFGQFEEREGGLWVPVSVQVSHLFVDGVALGEMAERVREIYSQAG